MREMKFRAWDGEFMWDDIQWLDLNKGSVFAFEGTSHGSARGTRSGSEIVSVMQYTGLTDKNGVEIYEGDYWLLDKMVYQVIFRAGQFVVKPVHRRGKGRRLSSIEEALAYMPASGSVIGNTYENPELVKQAA